jgi:SAM-dependent methyltransferase
VVTAGANEYERRRWNDESWAEAWPKRERLTDGVTAYLLRASALMPGERVLDVGCGGGKTSLAAAKAVGAEGAVVGADISAPLNRLATGRATQADAGNVSFHVADMQTDRLDGEAFDAAISQFGVMFFEKPITAFGNIRDHLRRGGRLTFACWQPADRNPWFPGEALAEYVPPPPAPEPGKSPTGPFTLADPEQTTALLEAAGFTEIRRQASEIAVAAPLDSIVDEAQLHRLSVPEDRLPEAWIAVRKHMKRFRLDSSLSRFPLAFQVFLARNPS